MERCIEREPQELRDISLYTAIRMCNWAASIYTGVHFIVTALYSNQKVFNEGVPSCYCHHRYKTLIQLKMCCSTSNPGLRKGFLPILDSIRRPNLCCWFFFFSGSLAVLQSAILNWRLDLYTGCWEAMLSATYAHSISVPGLGLMAFWMCITKKCYHLYEDMVSD